MHTCYESPAFSWCSARHSARETPPGRICSYGEAGLPNLLTKNPGREHYGFPQPKSGQRMSKPTKQSENVIKHYKSPTSRVRFGTGWLLAVRDGRMFPLRRLGLPCRSSLCRGQPKSRRMARILISQGQCAETCGFFSAVGLLIHLKNNPIWTYMPLSWLCIKTTLHDIYHAAYESSKTKKALKLPINSYSSNDEIIYMHI
jgi:hypothetical protein